MSCLYLFVESLDLYSIASKKYLDFLFIPWKVITFLVATCGLVFVAPYVNDPTWDRVNSLFMSVLTFLTSPWVTGILFLSLKNRYFDRKTLFAICLWMFSASWSYDLYLLLRDGEYPITWLPNIFASSVLYFNAGLLWNLDWRSGRGVTFSFLEKDWLATPTVCFKKIFWFALPFILFVSIAIGSFLDFYF